MFGKFDARGVCAAIVFFAQGGQELALAPLDRAVAVREIKDSGGRFASNLFGQLAAEHRLVMCFGKEQALGAAVQRVDEVGEEARCGRRNVRDMLHVNHEIVRGRELGGDRVEQRLRGTEHQFALQLVDANCPPMLDEARDILGRPRLAGRDLVRAVARTDHCGGRRTHRLEEMQVEILGQRLADGDAARAVAPFIEGRRVHPDAYLPGQHGDDATANAALGRHADVVDPRAGCVVHAA